MIKSVLIKSFLKKKIIKRHYWDQNLVVQYYVSDIRKRYHFFKGNCSLSENIHFLFSFKYDFGLTRAGPLLGAERAGPGGVFEHPPPSNSAHGPYSDTR